MIEFKNIATRMACSLSAATKATAVLAAAGVVFSGPFTDSASAATISWSGVTYINTGESSGITKGTFGIDQFDQSGSLFMAVSLGSSAATLVQSSDPNIAFAASDVNLTLTNFTGSYGSYYPLGSSNNDIARTGVFGATSGTVMLNGLTENAEYRIQALLVDGRGGVTGRYAKFGSSNLGTFANGVPSASWGDSLVGVGTFTANATSQSFTIQIFNANDTSAGTQLNAIIVHQVPEPGSLALVGLGGLCLLRRRRA